MSFITVRQRSRIAWIALVAVLLSTFAPAVSRVLAGTPAGVPWGGVFGEICSADTSGKAWAPHGRPAGEPAPAGGATLPFEHCPYCLSQTGSAPLPAAPQASPGAAPGHGPLPSWPGVSAPVLAHAWPAAQPRAPPQRT